MSEVSIEQLVPLEGINSMPYEEWLEVSGQKAWNAEEGLTTPEE